MKLRSLIPIAIVPLLSGCSTGRFRLFHPDSPISAVEWRFTLIDVGTMLLIILPVTLLAILFFWRYRKSRNAEYDPTWNHSMGLELMMWGIPILIVAFLGYESYRSTLLVNPFNPGALNMNDPANPALEVDVITTIWDCFSRRFAGCCGASGQTLFNLDQCHQRFLYPASRTDDRCDAGHAHRGRLSGEQAWEFRRFFRRFQWRRLLLDGVFHPRSHRA
jgi:hypothetical protein